jgi:hypothetical protein
MLDFDNSQGDKDNFMALRTNLISSFGLLNSGLGCFPLLPGWTPILLKASNASVPVLS